MRLFAIAAALAALALAPAPAVARGIGDCEKISEPDAYNKCLASFGPARGSARKLGAAPRRAHHRPAGSAARRSGVTVERKGGRVRAIIDLKR